MGLTGLESGYSDRLLKKARFLREIGAETIDTLGDHFARVTS
jgi:hypothetical protein